TPPRPARRRGRRSATANRWPRSRRRPGGRRRPPPRPARGRRPGPAGRRRPGGPGAGRRPRPSPRPPARRSAPGSPLGGGAQEDLGEGDAPPVGAEPEQEDVVVGAVERRPRGVG